MGKGSGRAGVPTLKRSTIPAELRGFAVDKTLAPHIFYDPYVDPDCKAKTLDQLQELILARDEELGVFQRNSEPFGESVFKLFLHFFMCGCEGIALILGIIGCAVAYFTFNSAGTTQGTVTIYTAS